MSAAIRSRGGVLRQTMKQRAMPASSPTAIMPPRTSNAIATGGCPLEDVGVVGGARDGAVAEGGKWRVKVVPGTPVHVGCGWVVGRTLAVGAMIIECFDVVLVLSDVGRRSGRLVWVASSEPSCPGCRPEPVLTTTLAEVEAICGEVLVAPRVEDSALEVDRSFAAGMALTRLRGRLWKKFDVAKQHLLEPSAKRVEAYEPKPPTELHVRTCTACRHQSQKGPEKGRRRKEDGAARGDR